MRDEQEGLKMGKCIQRTKGHYSVLSISDTFKINQTRLQHSVEFLIHESHLIVGAYLNF